MRQSCAESVPKNQEYFCSGDFWQYFITLKTCLTFDIEFLKAAGETLSLKDALIAWRVPYAEKSPLSLVA